MSKVQTPLNVQTKLERDEKAVSVRGVLSSRQLLVLMLAFLLTIQIAGCTVSAAPSVPTSTLAEELIFYDFPEDLPQSVLDAFSEEYGVKVTYLTYDSAREAEDSVAEGGVYDVAVLESDGIALLAEDGCLAAIDYANVPNFKHIAPNFKNLVYDPGNTYAIPFNWGTSGLVVRSDLVEEMPRHWADLWDPRYVGKVALRQDMVYDAIGLTLKSLGYSINSEEPDELAEALDRLLELKPDVVFVSAVAEEALPTLLSDEIAIMVGWAEDVLLGQEHNENIVYVLPEEGTMLWGDSFVIPVNSPHKETAEIFLNFLLRPEISAQIVAHNYYATANEAAYPFIEPEIREDPVVFPPQDILVNSEVFLPLSEEGDDLRTSTWEAFLSQ